MGVDIEQVIKNVNAAYYIAALIKQEINIINYGGNASFFIFRNHGGS